MIAVKTLGDVISFIFAFAVSIFAVFAMGWIGVSIVVDLFFPKDNGDET